MIWHIFKKDWKLTWKFVAAVASLHWIAAFVKFRLGVSGESEMLSMLAQMLPGLSLFGSMFLIGAIVHVDAIPGVRQDWLARPIPRGKLLQEKFLYVVATVCGPIFAANLFLGLANGFSMRSAAVQTTIWVVYIMFLVVLPIFALASVTRNMTEAFVAGCGCAFLIGASITLVEFANSANHGTIAAVTGSGIGWIGEAIRLGLAAMAAAMILGVQYFRRKTVVARGLLVGFGVLIMASQIFPWNAAFAIQQRLSARASSDAHLLIAFEPMLGRYKSSGEAAVAEDRRRSGSENDADVFLPLQVAGVGDDAMLVTDRADVRLTVPEGQAEYHGTGEDFEVRREGNGPPTSPVYQKIVLPGSVYRDWKDRAAQIQIEYSLTRFALKNSYAMPALNGSERMPGWGWCKTEVNEAGTALELHCLQQGKGPICGMVFLENAVTGERNPPRSMCRSDYAPYLDRPLPDSLERFGTMLPFRDPTGLAKFPVDGAQLANARVVIRLYRPEKHFMQSLTIPQIKLRDWDAQ
jgi:hypothetical protein